jgi:hypothetical protein
VLDKEGVIMAVLVAAQSLGEEIKKFVGLGDIEIEKGPFPQKLGLWAIDSPGPGEWIKAGRNGAAVEMVMDGAYIRHELWEGRPPQIGSWDFMWTGDIYFTSGKIVAVSNFDDDYSSVFDLGRRDTVWSVVASGKLLENDREPDFPRSIYRVHLFKFQFWLPS